MTFGGAWRGNSFSTARLPNKAFIDARTRSRNQNRHGLFRGRFGEGIAPREVKRLAVSEPLKSAELACPDASLGVTSQRRFGQFTHTPYNESTTFRTTCPACFHLCRSADDVGHRAPMYGADHDHRGDVDGVLRDVVCASLMNARGSDLVHASCGNAPSYR